MLEERPDNSWTGVRLVVAESCYHARNVARACRAATAISNLPIAEKFCP
jgi:hypothetical protein